ncbi:hypothetical protein SORBI_3K044200 [Sorghum bicolor]|uniref:Uncharacterized protein n=1 Tax=Sorghum bicolor TaxID=4558 RepID=A0A109NDW0_SORBI|nr:hypothetical protein SORBI_3K044200 [Sorghum bicolor]
MTPPHQGSRSQHRRLPCSGSLRSGGQDPLGSRHLCCATKAGTLVHCRRLADEEAPECRSRQRLCRRRVWECLRFHAGSGFRTRRRRSGRCCCERRCGGAGEAHDVVRWDVGPCCTRASWVDEVADARAGHHFLFSDLHSVERRGSLRGEVARMERGRHWSRRSDRCGRRQ